jgi:hypothetical protein
VTDLAFETSQLQLLTDALRAGPGTPEWRAALASVEANAGIAGAGADEYKLLYAARERLASGRRYREVRAGPGFTRKLNEAMADDEAGRKKTLPSANIIAAVSALVILGVLAVVAFFVMPRADQNTTPNELANTYFVETLAANEFSEDLGMQWASFGQLAVEARGGLQPVLTNLTPEFRGGGAFYERTLLANQPFAVEATITVPKTSEDVAFGIFVTDDPNFSGDSATSEHELVCLARGGKVNVVLPQAHLVGQSFDIGDGRMSLSVRIALNQTEGVVEVNGAKIWSGGHELSPNKDRLVGVRFLARSDGKGQKNVPRPVVDSLRILTPQKK